MLVSLQVCFYRKYNKNHETTKPLGRKQESSRPACAAFGIRKKRKEQKIAFPGDILECLSAMSMPLADLIFLALPSPWTLSSWRSPTACSLSKSV